MEISMNTIKVSEQQLADNAHGIDVRRVYNTEYALASHLTLKPGEKLIRHITPVDVFFYVLEGTGIIEVGDEKREVSQDTVIDSPKDVPHCWYNESEAVLRILVVKIPRPSTATKLL
jgi:mannose-6-phosphate isomerase-like protein (cupin superfamily)